MLQIYVFPWQRLLLVFFLAIISPDGNETYIIHNIEKEPIFDIVQSFIFLKYFKNHYPVMLSVVVSSFPHETLGKTAYTLPLTNMQVPYYKNQSNRPHSKDA